MRRSRQSTSTPFEFSVPNTLKRFGGLMRNGSAVIPPGYLREAINIRYTNGQIRERGGLTKATVTPLTGTIYGVYDDLENTLGTLLYYAGSLKIYNADAGTVTALVSGSTVQTVAPDPLISNSSKIYFLDSTSGFGYIDQYTGAAVSPTYIITAADLGSPGSYNDACRFNGEFFISVIKSGATRIYQYGSSVSLEQTIASSGARGLLGNLTAASLLIVLTNSAVFAGLGALRKRSTSGTYTTIETGLVYNNLVGSGAELSSNFYWPARHSEGDEVAIQRTDGSTWGGIRRILGSAADVIGTGGNIRNCCCYIFDSKLYYLYTQNVAGVYKLRLGRFNGTTWTDVHCEIANVDSDTHQSSRPFLTSYRSNLCAFVGTYAYQSSGTTTSTMTAISGLNGTETVACPVEL